MKPLNSSDEAPTVKPKHSNLRDEIMETGHLKMSGWYNVVMEKARRYWDTYVVRNIIKCFDDNPSPHYAGKILTLEHLVSIILYCDFSVLCTEFSKTFRKENVFESDESLIYRHSAYAIFGKLLSELVRIFGCSRDKGNGADGPDSGPFYCGLHRVSKIGAFALTLRGPTSTSKVRVVAQNFAREKGVILSLNNDTMFGTALRFFNCSWISDYPEESERLWIGGWHPLRIVSVIVVENATDYGNVMRGLHFFDAMVSGIRLAWKSKYAFNHYQQEINQSDHELISNLMDWTLNGENIESSAIDEFIKNEWTLFLQKKKTLKVDLFLLSRNYENLWDLILFNLVNPGDNGSVTGNDNVVRPEWISMFPSVRTLEISTSEYRFRLEELAESMKSISPLITVFVSGGWIQDALVDQIEIFAAFNSAGWNIEYKNNGLVIESISQ